MSRPAPKAINWPILVKVGSSVVKIFSTPEGDTPRYTVAWYEAGDRKRLTRVDLGEARAEAKQIAERLDGGRGPALELTGPARDAVAYALAKLRPVGVPINVAIDEYLKARSFGAPIVEAAKTYAEAHDSKLPERTVSQVYDEMLAAKKKDGLSEAYLHDLRARVGPFARDFRESISSVQTADIDMWLRGRKVSIRSRNNHRSGIIGLFSFAKAAGYLNRDRAHAAEHTAVARGKVENIEVLTPAEFARILGAADDTILPHFVLGGLCGLRTCEVMRLDWSDVRWSESAIIIRASISKTRTRRAAVLTDAAAAWLSKFKSKTGRVLTLTNPDTRVRGICEDLGLTWKRNALRHTFISARLATVRDPVRVAFECGNSPKIIRSNYDAVFTEAEGKRWFAIRPGKPANLIEMAAVTA